MNIRSIPPLAGAVLVVAAFADDSSKSPYTIPNSPVAAKEMGERQGKLKPGDVAPDFHLNVLRSQKSVRLSGFKNKRPVALVFGSYT